LIRLDPAWSGLIRLDPAWSGSRFQPSGHIIGLNVLEEKSEKRIFKKLKNPSKKSIRDYWLDHNHVLNATS
jgi:hypothetical protein